jgi:hypothetical protein
MASLFPARRRALTGEWKSDSVIEIDIHQENILGSHDMGFE